MNSDQKGRCALVIVVMQLFFVLPIWTVLAYSVLDKIEAETWQWVLFWIYVPVAFASNALAKFITGTDKP